MTVTTFGITGYSQLYDRIHEDPALVKGFDSVCVVSGYNNRYRLPTISNKVAKLATLIRNINSQAHIIFSLVIPVQVAREESLEIINLNACIRQAVYDLGDPSITVWYSNSEFFTKGSLKPGIFGPDNLLSSKGIQLLYKTITKAVNKRPLVV